MSVLIHEPRVDKSGIVVTRYVRSASSDPSVPHTGDYSLPVHSRTIETSEPSGEPADAFADDAILSQADYIEVSSEGVTYGLDVSESILRTILIGTQNSDEDSVDYGDRFREVLTDFDPSPLVAYFRDTYGAEFVQNSNDGSFTLEFFLSFDGEEVPLESMALRAAKETDLMEARDDYLNSDALISGTARSLGYVWHCNAEGGKFLESDTATYRATYAQHEVLDCHANELYDKASQIGSFTSSWSEEADLYNSAASRISAIGSQHRECNESVAERLLKEAADHRMKMESEPDGQIKTAHAYLSELYMGMAAEVEDAL